LANKLLLFDIDSTLLRAEDATHQAMDRAFRDIFGSRAATKGVNFFGRTDPELFQEAAVGVLGRKLSSDEYAAVVRLYLSFLPEELERCTFYLMPGVAQLLPALAAREEVLLGLETGNLEPSAYMKLKRGDIAHYFRFGGFGSDSEDRTELVLKAIQRSRKHNGGTIPGENIYIIGDSPHDIVAGKNCGANTIAVTTGKSDKAKLLAAGPTFMLADLNDIPLFMRQIGLKYK
jgi:phosphoglycolate phosphatase-like HAD superfamily hydrolase